MISKINLKNKGILAPMLEYTNLPFRQLCAKNNCGLAYTEMVHINHIVNKPIYEIAELKTQNEDYLVALQLVGDFTNLKQTKSAFEIVENIKDYDIIDFNLGCPSLKIIAGKSGSILLEDIDLVSKTLKELKEISNKPITAKIRLGYKKDHCLEIIKSLEKANIDAVAIHARLGITGYNTPADYKRVLEIIKETSLPIFYNGDINLENISTFKDIDAFSGLMIGRSALANPSIFDEIANKKQRTLQNNISDFLKLSKKYENSLINQKLLLLQMLNGFKGARQLRGKLTNIKTQEELDSFCLEIEKVYN